MITSTIRVSDTLSPALAAAGAQASPSRCAKIAARLAADIFVGHFEGLSQSRHRPGMSHDFYLQAARATIGTAVGAFAVVTVRAPTGLRQRLKGGPIRPTKTYKLRGGRTYSALWIPVGAAVGRTGGDFRGQLAVIWNSATLKGVAIDRKTKAVLFALTGNTINQPKDPTVLPNMRELRLAVRAGVAQKIESAWRRKHAEQ